MPWARQARLEPGRVVIDIQGECSEAIPRSILVAVNGATRFLPTELSKPLLEQSKLLPLGGIGSGTGGGRVWLVVGVKERRIERGFIRRPVQSICELSNSGGTGEEAAVRHPF